MQTVRFANGVTLELRTRRGEFLGLGRVRIGRTVVRSGRRPMFVEIRSPYGTQLCHYRLTRQEPDGDGVRLFFAMDRQDGGPMEWQLHACRRRYATTDWSQGPQPLADTELRLDLQPVTRDVGHTRYQGFRYQYHYRSGSVPIYCLLDRGTWELGGDAVGNEFWMRNCFTPVIYRVGAVGEHYSTEWYLGDIANPNIFQFLPLQTELQGFSFTTGPAGVLVTWPTAVAHVRSLFEKPRGSRDFVHLHEHCGDLGHELSTAPMEVLFAPGTRDWVGRANAHGEMAELVSATLHADAGLRRERVTSYGMIEEWGDADLDLYRREGLPRLLALGLRTIGLANHFQNNMNTYGVSNMCCTVDYQVAASVGEDRLRAFCAEARAAGSRVEMWGNTALSTLTVILHQHNGQPKRIEFLPQDGSIMAALERASAPFVRTSFGAIEADHYTPVFAVLNLRDPVVREYWRRRWQYAHDTVGLGGIFMDSSFNLSSDKFHFAYNAQPGTGSGATADQTGLLGKQRPAQEPPAAILSQYRAHLDLVREMQQMGYAYCNEDLGVFGVHRHGPGIEQRLGSLPLWTDCLAGFDARAIRAAGGDPEDVFFRGLAYRMVWMIYWHVASREVTFRYEGARGDDDRPTAWHAALLRAFDEVAPSMDQREILAGEWAVRYRAPDGKGVLWAVADGGLALEQPLLVRDVLAATTVRTDRLSARKHHVYLLADE